MNLSENVLIGEVGAPVALADDTDDNSDRLDMAGFDGVVFIAVIDDSVDTGVATITVEQNTADSDSGMAALSGATATDTSATNDDLNGKVLIVDVYKPLERYLQLVRTSTIANIAFGTVIALRYGPHKLPITDDSTVLAIATVASPAEA